MKQHYLAQTRLLLDVLPVIRNYPDFALKGGTALNYFLHDLPRLSVDIDLQYLPITERPEALADIHSQMRAMCDDVRRSFPGIQCHYDERHYRIPIRYQHADIKIETIDVIRGRVFEPSMRSLAPRLVARFDQSFDINCLHPADLYAGKLCAALDRQHPRDLFDINILLDGSGVIGRDVVLAFVVYLAGSKKSIHELLDPRIKDIRATFEQKFEGMSASKIELADLEHLQLRLPGIIRNALTESDRQFLLGFKKGKPDWDLLPIRHAKTLPAVRWKILNLDKMDNGDRQKAIKKLEEVLNRPPDHETGTKGQAMEDEKITPSQQLAEEIVQALIDSEAIDKKRRHELINKIVAGETTPDDWALWADMAAQPRGQAITDD